MGMSWSICIGIAAWEVSVQATIICMFDYCQYFKIGLLEASDAEITSHKYKRKDRNQSIWIM